MVVKALGLLYAIWGFNWVVMKEATLFFPPLTFAGYRMLSAALVLLLVSAWFRLPPPPRQYWPWLAITGLLQITVNMGAVQVGMESLPAGLVAVLNYSMPVWMAVLAYFFLSEPLTKRKIGGIIACMVGMVLLMNVSSLGSVTGMVITIGGAVAWAIAGVVLKRHPLGKECSMLQFTTWQIVIGSLVLWGISLTEEGAVTWNLMAVICVAYNGILASAVAFFLWNYILTHMEAGKASVAVLGVPVVGVLCSLIFLGEALQWHTAFGMILILAGIFCIVAPLGFSRKMK